MFENSRSANAHDAVEFRNHFKNEAKANHEQFVPTIRIKQGEFLMNTSKSLKKLLPILMIIVFLTSMSTSVAFADDANPPKPDYNTQTETRPDIGQQEKGDVGQHGYKVFMPGAIASVAASPLDASLKAASVFRSGSTDAWLNFVVIATPPYSGWDHLGGHQSGSDLWESEIWVDGFLKITNDSSWRASCSQHATGSSAYCVTSFNQLLPRLINGKTNHHFHMSGYVDQNFSTADSA
jgi:hypothetical protein